MISPEVLQNLPEITSGLALIAFGLAFSIKQRNWIRDERDGGKCRATAKHACNEEKGLEVDHILPQRYLYLMGVDPDFPENALSKCKNSHNIKHPDRVETLKKYHELKAQGIDAFQVLGEERDKKLKNRVIYWNDSNDRTDQVVALRLTQKATKEGKIFPQKKQPKK